MPNPRIILRAPTPSLRALLAEVLGSVTPEIRLSDEPVFEAGVRFGSAVPRAAREAVQIRLSPLGLKCSEDASMEAGSVDVAVVAPASLGPVNVTVHADCPALARRILAALEPWCATPPDVKILSGTTDPGLQYGGAPCFLRGLARLAGGTGRKALPETKAWGDHDMDLWIYARSPVRPTLPIEVLTDDEERAEGLVRDLLSNGFTDVRVGPLAGTELGAARFAILPGALASRPGEDTLGRLQFLTGLALGAAEVDPDQWPLQVGASGGLPAALVAAREARRGATEDLHVRVLLPFGAHARGALRPYNGGSRSRFAVTVRSDDAAVAGGVVGALRAAGFPDVTGSPLAEDDDEASIHMEDLSSENEALGFLREALATALPGRCAPANREVAGLDHRVIVVLPMHLTEAERALRARGRLAAYNVVVQSARGERNPLAKQLIAELREAGFRRVRARRGEDGPVGVIRYGGADAAALALLTNALARRGVTVADAEQVWPPSDMDICVCVPDGPAERDAGASTVDPFASWEGCTKASPGRARSFIGTGQLWLNVGETRLACKAGTLLPPAGFESYVADATTAATLAHLAVAVKRREPVLLEGPTCTSKTSVILNLAALLGQAVVRVNLSAQTDTSELLGRYLPTGGGGRAAWRWQDGRVVRAMREGAWVIFDEINLAEPAVLERLNPLLEATPGLVLTEHDGEVFGPGGTPIHASFRVFATMNPSSYAGRCALSPAFRDRFLGYRSVPAPTEADMRQMLERVVLGAGHTIVVEGRSWAVPGGPPVFPWTAEDEAVPRALSRLARLWTSLAGMDPGDGADAGREGAVYTRRGLLAIVQAVSAATDAHEPLDSALRAALRRYVVGRVTAPTERVALAHVLDACGLGPGQWNPCGPARSGRPPGDGEPDDVDGADQ